MEQANFLSNVAIFSHLDVSDLGFLGSKLRRRTFQKGEVLFHQDDPGDRLHFVADGLVKISIVSPDGRENYIALLMAGTVSGGYRRGFSGELTDTNIQVNAISPGSINTRMWEDLRDGALAVDDTRLVELSQRILSGGGASLERAVELAVFLAGDTSGDLSGRLIRATDDFSNMPTVISEIMESDAYTMRRVEF